MSDHGISVGEKIGERAYGSFCYDYTLKTFTYFLYPEVKPLEIKQQVRTIDFFPTILDYLQIPIDPNFQHMDGRIFAEYEFSKRRKGITVPNHWKVKKVIDDAKRSIRVLAEASK